MDLYIFTRGTQARLQMNDQITYIRQTSFLYHCSFNDICMLLSSIKAKDCLLMCFNEKNWEILAFSLNLEVLNHFNLLVKGNDNQITIYVFIYIYKISIKKHTCQYTWWRWSEYTHEQMHTIRSDINSNVTLLTQWGLSTQKFRERTQFISHEDWLQ